MEESTVPLNSSGPQAVPYSPSEDDLADELIAQNPAFQTTVERARRQKAAGKVKTLAELREKYKVEWTRAQLLPSGSLVRSGGRVRKVVATDAGKVQRAMKEKHRGGR